MKNLVINTGSSSLKFSVFNDESVVISGLCEKIGSEDAIMKTKFGGKKIVNDDISMLNHRDAFSHVIDLLKEKELLNDIEFVSHRIVHGGENFKSTILVNDEIVKELEKNTPLAPLHNPPNIEGIKIMRDLLPDSVKHFCVFDTAYHQTMPESAYLYPVPYNWYKKHGVRKYGFHGSSHKYVINEAMKILNKDDAKIISCHLGNGASICASIGGKSVNTSMGMTPLDGLMMGTRSGSIDPAIISYVMEKEKLSAKEIENLLNKKSGLLGVSEISNDMRDIEEAMEKDDEGAHRAMNLFCNRLVQIVGSYIAELNGVDAIIFTAGIGEKGSVVRNCLVKHLGFIGAEIDEEKNNSNFKGEISSENSKIKIFIIPTDEELQMTLDSKEMMKN